jgi:hypothetical protein
MGDTSVVNMVQRVSKKTLLEPGDTRQQWKGEAAASFVSAGIASSRMLPTSSVGYWPPYLSCSYNSYKSLRRDVFLRGHFLARNPVRSQFEDLTFFEPV